MSSRGLATGAAVVALGLVALLAACTSSSTPAAQRPSVPAFATSSTPAAPIRTSLPTDCSDVVTATDVDAIVGHSLIGSSSQVVGVAMPKIHRLGRLDCYFGIPAGKPVTSGVVSIGIGRYTDAASAAHRTSLTVNTARSGGAQVSDLKVDGGDALLVADQRTQELVLSRGSLTVLVIAADGVLPNGRIGEKLTTLAERAVEAHG
jgi:hypothetical protein